MAEEDELGSFFAEINEITAQVEESKSENVANISAESDVPPFKKALPSSQPISIVYSKAPELREVAVKASHAVYTYDQPELHQLGENYAEDQPQYSAAAHYSQPPPPPPPAAPFIPRSNKTFVRKAADEVWVDETLQEWPENDFRIFVGDLAKETTTEILTKHFQTYKSFAKAKVIRTKDGKTKGFGFVSFLEPADCIKAIREQNGKYLGSRPMKIKRSDWKDRDLEEVKKSDQRKRKFQETYGLS